MTENTKYEAIELTDKNFNKKVLHKSEKLVVVLFYASWCPHCKNFLPTYNELAKQNEGKQEIQIYQIESKYEMIFKKYDIKGYPTIKFFTKKSYIEYTGNRSINDLEAQIAKLLKP